MGGDELFDPDSYRDSSINPDKSGQADLKMSFALKYK